MRTLPLLLFLLPPALFGVVDIAPVEIGEKAGFSGNVSGSFVTKRGNTDKDEYSAGLKLQYDEASRYVAWGVLSYDYGKSSDVKNEDKTYAHLRYIRRLYGEDLCGELFVQTEQDRFKDINNRSLAGAGVRWRFFNSSEWGKGYFGLGGFYEYVDYSDAAVNPTEENARLNSYVAYTKSFASESTFSYVGYYQPKFDESSDFVTLQSLELLLPVYEKLSLSFSVELDYDSRPPAGIKKRNTAQKTALSWRF